MTKTCNQVFEKIVLNTKAWTVDKSTLLILENLQSDKRASVRSCCIEILCIYLDKWISNNYSLCSIMDRLEKAIQKCVADQDSNVRKQGRDALYLLSISWPDSSSRYTLWVIILISFLAGFYLFLTLLH